MTTSRDREYSRGALAKASGVNIETIRFYERIGLMPAPPRSAAGYRRYSALHLNRLAFISRAKRLGFRNEEILALLTMADGKTDCAAARAIASANRDLVVRKIEDLTRMKVALDRMIEACDGAGAPDCALIDHLCEGV